MFTDLQASQTANLSTKRLSSSRTYALCGTAIRLTRRTPKQVVGLTEWAYGALRTNRPEMHTGRTESYSDNELSVLSSCLPVTGSSQTLRSLRPSSLIKDSTASIGSARDRDPG